MGCEAAALLDTGRWPEPPPSEPVLIEPLGMVERQSTDVTAVSDADVAAALHFIREHACGRAPGVGRSANGSVSSPLPHLETQSSLDCLGRSPKAEILRVGINGVRRLLAMTDISLEDVARRTGLSYVENMCTAFRKRTGQTPGRYRQGIKAKS